MNKFITIFVIFVCIHRFPCAFFFINHTYLAHGIKEIKRNLERTKKIQIVAGELLEGASSCSYTIPHLFFCVPVLQPSVFTVSS